MPGRDMSSGSHAIREVKSAFTRMATTLRQLTSELEHPLHSSQGDQPAAAAVQLLPLEHVASAVATAALASPAAAGSHAAPQQQQQQAGGLQFGVVEDREAWAAVQADGQAQSVQQPGAAAAAADQQLNQALKGCFGMLGQMMDVVAAVGRGAGADARRSEQARQTALRGKARYV